MGLGSTYGPGFLKAGAIKEDLLDIITNIDPVTTWCTSRFGDTTAHSVNHEWLLDTLASPGANAVAEGSDASDAVPTYGTRSNNYTQILRWVYLISDTLEVVAKAGRKSELAYQKEKAFKQLSNDIEYALIMNGAAASASAGSARTLRGVINFIATNTASATASAWTAASAGSAAINTLLSTMFMNGAKPQSMIVGTKNKLYISSWTANNTRWIQADEKAIVNAVDLYRSDFGDLKIFPHRILAGGANSGYIVIFGDMNLWKTAYLRRPKDEKLARTGSATKWMVETELTIECRAEKGSGWYNVVGA